MGATLSGKYKYEVHNRFCDRAHVEVLELKESKMLRWDQSFVFHTPLPAVTIRVLYWDKGTKKPERLFPDVRIGHGGECGLKRYLALNQNNVRVLGRREEEKARREEERRK